MKDKVLLYISAAPELKLERAMLNKAITEIPTSLGWKIVQTPRQDGYAENEPNLDAVLHADVHLLILGEDVKAPIGVEWRQARRAGLRPFLFNKDVLRTQAGESFKRDLAQFGEWRAFKDAVELKRLALSLLVDHLIAHAVPYALQTQEVERLRDWLVAQSKAKPKLDDARGGTDNSGVILSTERFVPSDGTLLGRWRSNPGTENSA